MLSTLSLMLPVFLLYYTTPAMQQPMFHRGNAVCDDQYNRVNRHTIYSVIHSLPALGHVAIPGQLQDSERFIRVIPANPFWPVPALFETANGDSQVYVSMRYSKGPLNMHNDEEMFNRIWTMARNMALELWNKCEMKTTGRGGVNKLGVRLGFPFPASQQLMVRVGRNLAQTSSGQVHRAVTVYKVLPGGGRPVLLRPARLLRQPSPPHSVSRAPLPMDESLCKRHIASHG